MTQRRRALVAGAVGRLGEALLNRVLGSGDYHEVVVLADTPMSLGVRGLSLAALDALPPVDDAFVLLGDADDASARSYYGRDAPFVQVHGENCLAVTGAAVAHGAKRIVLVSPMPAWQQIGHFHRGLANAVELSVSQLPVESLVVLRPVREARRPGGSLVERFVAVYLSLQLLMLPRSVQAMTSDKLARCILEAMRRAGPGLEVRGADALPALLPGA